MLTMRRQLTWFLLVPAMIIIASNLIGKEIEPFVARIHRLSNWVAASGTAVGITTAIIALAITAIAFDYRIRRQTALNEWRQAENVRRAHARGYQGASYACVGLQMIDFRSPPRIGLPLLSRIILCAILPFLLIGAIVAVYTILSVIYAAPLFKKYNIIVFFIIMLGLFQFTLRRDTLQSLTWKKLSWWLKAPRISIITIGGFGVIATSNTIRIPLLKLTLESEYTNMRLIVTVALIGIATMACALTIDRIGRFKAPTEDGNLPAGWLYTTFGLAFVSNTLMFTLLMTSVFLTMNSHYTQE